VEGTVEVVGLWNAIFGGINGSLVLVGEYRHLGSVDCWMLSCHEAAEKRPILDVFVPKEDCKRQLKCVAISSGAIT